MVVCAHMFAQSQVIFKFRRHWERIGYFLAACIHEPHVPVDLIIAPPHVDFFSLSVLRLVICMHDGSTVHCFYFLTEDILDVLTKCFRGVIVICLEHFPTLCHIRCTNFSTFYWV